MHIAHRENNIAIYISKGKKGSQFWMLDATFTYIYTTKPNQKYPTDNFSYPKTIPIYSKCSRGTENKFVRLNSNIR